jgi:hypothetical protein
MTKTTLIFLFLSLVLAAPACRRKSDRNSVTRDQIAETEHVYAQEPPAESAQQGVHGLENALDLWKKNQKEQAKKAFLAIDWTQPTRFSPDSVLSLSEKQFTSLPEPRRLEIQRQAMDVAATIRQLVKHVTSLGRAYMAKKDYDAAQNCFEAVLHCGKALSNPDSLLIIKMTGDAIQKLATRELTALGEQVGSQQK